MGTEENVPNELLTGRDVCFTRADDRKTAGEMRNKRHNILRTNWLRARKQKTNNFVGKYAGEETIGFKQ